jgi:hypothetical protein
VALDEDAILGDIMEELNNSDTVRPSTPRLTKLRSLTPVQSTDMAARYKYSIFRFWPAANEINCVV